jgi:hypothetical protein
MTLDLYGLFITQFPEFVGVAPSQINAFLAAAALEIDTQVWGATAQQGQFWLAAHRLAASPFGQAAKMITSPLARRYDRTTYGQTFKELQIQASSGFRVC